MSRRALTRHVNQPVSPQGSEVVCSDLSHMDGDRGVRGIHVKVHARPYHALQVPKPDLVIGWYQSKYILLLRLID